MFNIMGAWWLVVNRNHKNKMQYHKCQKYDCIESQYIKE